MQYRCALVLLLLAPLTTSAAELGRITVLSIVGEPLNAEIDIDEAPASETLAVKLASREEHDRAQLAPIPGPDTVRAEIARRPDGRPFVRLRSNQPIEQPLVNVLVGLSWAGGSAARQYSFLLDSIDRRGARVAAAPAAKERASSAAPLPAPDTAARAAARRTYSVRPGETIYSVARATRHEGVTVAQMVVAIYRANGDAFTSGNIHRLQAGRTLAIPDRDAARAIAIAEARKLLAAPDGKTKK